MYFPDFEEFCNRARQGNLIPVYKEILADMETPVSAFLKIDHGEYAFLLESVEGGEKLARYSFLGSDPALVIKSRRNEVTVIESGRQQTIALRDGQTPLDIIKEYLLRYQPVEISGLPRFHGGAVGYLGYDMVRFFEDIPDTGTDMLELDDSLFMFTDTILVFDHVQHHIKVVSNAHIEPDLPLEQAYQNAIAQIEQICERLHRPCPDLPQSSGQASPEVSSNFTKQAYMEVVEKAKEYIAAGDIFQVVPSQRLEMEVKAHPFNVYRALRMVNPSPYMYYLRFPEFQVIGSSPEILVRKEGRQAEVRPIAGTRKRGSSEAEDQALIKDLLADPKERAEHIMLVDLGRNDLGRVCQYNTVETNELMVCEKYSHVIHLVSNVRGILRDDMDSFELLRATFPAGTVSGAPKIRAMEIIDELEPYRRGTYAGCVGYFSFSGNLDCCITIRTIIIKDGKAYVQAGGGVVADSDPENEYDETMKKARAMLKAITLAEEGLT